MSFVRAGSAIALAAVCVASSSAPAGAEEPMHQVTYSVFSELPFRAADIYYRDSEPANWADYSHDPYVFSPKVEADIGPGKKWVLNVQLANPDEWAMVAATSGQSPTPPNIHCVLAVDGVVVAENSGAKGALCSLRHW
ncbi:hypothetical protein H7J51_17205 [Mycobacterium crocinum]|uniref:Secreted protein n=2 Tax=Mycolicibacterium TaxID=1866885 RepID=A0ABX8VDN8_9MYCO|nr:MULTISPECIES: hypothetical protein [Mycolicibacterium]MCV7217014.1 hypothetical protein [Mycolicibacterium crocinum]QYL15612.1 hypothetical protein K0O64_21320 [Mycolicibacterium pallens]ULN40265.1 hypothetical protein MI149_21665 [Mycolicibacterium crocinum]